MPQVNERRSAAVRRSFPGAVPHRAPRAAIVLPALGLALAFGCGNVQPARPDGGPPPDAAIDSPEAMVTLTVTNTGSGSGGVTSSPAGIDCGAACTMQLPRGTPVMLSAAPAVGARFDGWTGPCSDASPTCTFTLDADTDVTAGFGIVMHAVSVTIVGNGMARVTSSPAGIDCPTTCSMMVPDGAAVSLTAMATDTTSQFLGWSDRSCAGTSTCAIMVAADTAISVAFGQNLSLVVTRTGTGSGTVTSDLPGIDCGTDCSETYAANSTVTLTASPSTGSSFTGWSGGGCSGAATCTVTIAGAIGVTATFSLNTYALTVVADGSGAGTVQSNPAGILCGTTCTATYSYGTTVALTAAPSPGSTFAGWSGGCTGTSTCSVAVTAATTVHATFQAIPRTLTVLLKGTGSVTSVPAGITCGTTCAATFDNGTTVTLTASPAPGLSFGGWAGKCSGTGTCTVTLTADTTITATFNGTAFTTSGNWSCANNASCQDVYDVSFPSNATVTLTVGSVDVTSAVRLAAFSPGTPLTGNDLLTGLTADRQCAVRGAGDAVSFRTTTAGIYRISVGRDWQKSSGASGTYGLTIASDAGLTFLKQSLDDAATGATGLSCGYTFTASNPWFCSVGVSCQDIYDFTTLAPTPITVAVTAVSGPSVVRMAVFHGSALNTTNLLNGNTADRRCAGVDQSDSATSTVLPSGQQRIAVGRDWASFPGMGIGMYRVTITTPSTPLIPGGQTSNDTSTQLLNTTCP